MLAGMSRADARAIRLYLIRHAVAVPKGAVEDDAARPLTDAGRARCARVVEGLERAGLRLGVVRHSPWTRAVQTAELLARLCDGKLKPDPLLAQPPGDELIDSLGGDRLALVGHQPWLGELAASLIGGSADLAPRLELKKGGVAWLEGPPRRGAMTLRALVPPRFSRRARE
jgi:phosphohistidine phosphatase